MLFSFEVADASGVIAELRNNATDNHQLRCQLSML